MFNIEHNDAIELEHIVTDLYDCERFGIAGLADAGIFENDPFYAAVLVLSYFYAKAIPVNDNELNEFRHKYKTIFDYPDENHASNKVKNYIADLKNIIEEYQK